MFFHVVANFPRPNPQTPESAYLVVDFWDDWGKYRTMFTLIVVDAALAVHRIGSVKIGQKGLKPAGSVPPPPPGFRVPLVPGYFETLTEDFFSLGQGEDYYVALNQLENAFKDAILRGLRDCAHDPRIIEENKNEEVMEESLLRSVQERNVRGRLHRLTKGDAQLTAFRFKYTIPQLEGSEPAVMSFVVTPEAQPPTNVHVIAGRNGAGKSHCLRQMAESLLMRESTSAFPGKIELEQDILDSWSFAGLIVVSFSAFDEFALKPEPTDQIAFHHVGLRKTDRESGRSPTILTPPELAAEFRKSLFNCRDGLKAHRWRAALETLDTDDLFAEANAAALLDLEKDSAWNERVEKFFSYLSSGHAIVLLTMTRLVELVDEKTLVLVDEPEGHLHPPLLSAFVRCLSDLLIKRNGVAVIATHSPVVLQEVPKSCAWKIRRSGSAVVVERPGIETFGENLGSLTREVFSFEVTRAGFHRMLEDAVQAELNFEQVLRRFNGQLGMEARAVVKGLIAAREASRGN